MARRAEHQLRPGKRARALLGATTLVLAAHAIVLLAMARHGSSPAVVRAGPRATPTIVLVDARRHEGLAATSARTPTSAPAETRDRAASPPVGQGADEWRPLPPTLLARAPVDPATAIGIYRAAAALDVPVRPRSAPDITTLAGLPWSGLPLRLRLFIDDAGAVVDVQVLQGAETDEVVERVRRMFLATGFTAGIQGGQPVPSYKDIELTIGAPS